MSSLIFFTDPKQALVVTDTLAVVDQGTPFLFTSKAHYLAHLRMVVAGTGHGKFLQDWFLRINTQMLVSGIEQLDAHTPDALRAQWEKWSSLGDVPSDATTTVYHFGVAETSGEITAFAYRSTNDFRSERLSEGLAVKPECEVPEGNILENIEAMMLDQRRIQAEKPIEQRVHIGGEANAILLTPEGCQHWSMFQFPDFAEQVDIAYSNLPPVG